MDAQAIIDLLKTLVPAAEIAAAAAADDAVTPALWVSAAHVVEVCRALRDTPGLEYVAFSNVTASTTIRGARRVSTSSTTWSRRIGGPGCGSRCSSASTSRSPR